MQNSRKSSQTARPASPRQPSRKIATGRVFQVATTPNFHEINQKLQIRPDNDRFPPKSHCRLSYQASAIPRIVACRTCRFAGTGSPFLFFDPAETT
jgi:hypothetical protein